MSKIEFKLKHWRFRMDFAKFLEETIRPHSEPTDWNDWTDDKQDDDTQDTQDLTEAILELEREG